jgi:tetratricopeptide (TPR) repeat protein
MPGGVPRSVGLARSWPAWVLLINIAMCPALRAAQGAGSDTIRGKVVGPDGRGVEIRVQLQNQAGYVVDTTYSDSNGQFTFQAVHDGVYIVFADDPAYRRAEASAHVAWSVVPTADVYISLEARGSPVKSSPRFESGTSTVSVKELKAKFPKKAVKEYEKGNAKLQRGDAKGAIPHYEKALQLAPAMYPVLNNLGNAYLQTHRTDLAEATFKKAMAADPAAADPLVNLGHLYYETQKYDQAEKFLLRGLEHDPQATLAYFLLGLTEVRLRKFRAAEENLEKSLIGGNPRMAQAHLILAELFMRSREFSKARRHLETYLKIRPQDPQADHIRAILSQLKAESNP